MSVNKPHTNIDPPFTRDQIARAKLTSAFNVLLGIWLICSPWIFGYANPTEAAAWSSLIAGFLVVFVGAMRFATPCESPAPCGVNIVLGAWILISPWLFDLDMETASFWNNVIVGIAVGALAICSAHATHGGQEHRPPTS